MRYCVDSPLSQFGFWSGAQDNAARLTAEELDRIDNELECCGFFGDDRPSACQINDLFWFDFDSVLSLIGLSEEELDEREKEEETES